MSRADKPKKCATESSGSGSESETAGNQSPETPATSPGDQDSSHDGRIGVVGIGASAGGLEAFGELLNALPVDTGMAFVLIQHLDPRHASSLAGSARPTHRNCPSSRYRTGRWYGRIGSM